MNRVETLNALKARAEKMRQEKDRAQGRLEEAQKRMQEEFGVSTAEEADKLLKKLKKETEAAQEKFDTELAAFQEKWGDQL